MPHKTLATRLVQLLPAPYTLRRGHALECVAALHGLPNWDTLAARPGAALLSAAQAHAPLHAALTRFGCPLTPDQTRALLAQLLRAAPPSPGGPMTTWRGLLVQTGTDTTLSPWPMLPLDTPDPATWSALADLCPHLTWTRGGPLTLDGNFDGWAAPHTFTVPTSDPEALPAWAAALLAALRGTSHQVTVHRDGAVLTGIDVVRGMTDPAQLRVAPYRTPRPLPVDADLHVIHGQARSDLGKRALVAAHAQASRAQVFLIDTPALLGQAGAALAGPCTLLPDTPRGVQALLRQARPGDVVVISDHAAQATPLIHAAQRRALRVIYTLHARLQEVLRRVRARGLDTAGAYEEIRVHDRVARQVQVRATVTGVTTYLDALPTHLDAWNTLLVSSGWDAYAQTARQDPQGRAALPLLREAYVRQADARQEDLGGDDTPGEAAEFALFSAGPDGIDALVNQDPAALKTLKQIQLQELRRRVWLADQALNALS